MKNLWLIFFSIVFICFSSISILAETPKVAAQGAVLLDGETGRVLWGKNEETPLAMASTTKIMTAILVLEEGNLDDMVEVTANAANSPKVRMNLSKGEEIRLGDLLYAMMLRSYNDAAVAIAEHMEGSVPDFCKKMTEKAKEIGATDTVFGSPNGLDSHLPFEKHHSTAKDMALIASYALKNPEFVKVINTQSVEIPMEGGTGKHYSVTNANRFLKMYEGACGVKTGFTNKAGQCFVGAAKRGDRLFVTAVLGSGWGGNGKEQKWLDTKALMNYGFENFEKKTVLQEGKITGGTLIHHSPIKQISGRVEKGCSLLLSEEQLQNIQVDTQQEEILEAPVQKGEKLGSVTISLDGKIIETIDILASESASKYTLKQRMKELIQQWSYFPSLG